MNKQTQLRGNCQICGGDYAVVGLHMSKHGYTVEHGWFEGVCSGERWMPLQKDRTGTDAVVVTIRQQAAELLEQANKFARGELTPKVVVRGYGQHKHEVPFEEGTKYEQERAVAQAEWTLRKRALAGQELATHLTQLADQLHGTELREVLLAKPQIEVGSKVKVQGDVVEVVRIEDRMCRGVGPSLNGTYAAHVVWVDSKGNEHAYPKRFARLV